METIKVKNEHYTIYNFLLKLFFSSIGQDKSKLQKQISKLLILTETVLSCLIKFNLL